MRVLAIDTVTEMCSVALSINGVLTTQSSLAANQHSQIVLKMVDDLLEAARIDLSQLDLIVTNVGPGSFTGIRIGIGVAQGLAFGAQVPVCGVDALSSLAFGARSKAIAQRKKGHIFAAIDARMGQIYWGLFVVSKRAFEQLGELQLSMPSELGCENEEVFTVGSGWDAYADDLSAQLSIAGSAEACFPLAEHTLALGMARPQQQWQSAGELMPVYLRNEVAKVSNKSLRSRSELSS